MVTGVGHYNNTVIKAAKYEVAINAHEPIKGTGLRRTYPNTISREGLKSPNKEEIGGLSGKPLTNRSTEVIRFLSEKSNKAFAIIAVGGIFTAEDALDKLRAGATLVQVYTGFIYEGPSMIKKINKGLIGKL